MIKDSYKVLIIDDNHGMAASLMDAFDRFNKNDLPLPDHLDKVNGHVTFDVSHCPDLNELPKHLIGLSPVWDVLVIDRDMKGQISDLEVLKTLAELACKGIWIVWTAHPDRPARKDPTTPNIIQCMRLGAWDYLDKTNRRSTSQCTDVIISALEGLAARKRDLLRAQLKNQASRFVGSHFNDFYEHYKGQFVAFIQDPNDNANWKPVASNPRLYALNSALEIGNYSQETIYITMIRTLS